MAPIDRAQDKWERKTSGSRWKSAVRGKRNAFAEGLANFAGVSASSIGVDDEWERETEAVSASEFDESVNGKGTKWRNNFLEGIQGE